MKRRVFMSAAFLSLLGGALGSLYQTPRRERSWEENFDEMKNVLRNSDALDEVMRFGQLYFERQTLSSDDLLAKYKKLDFERKVRFDYWLSDLIENDFKNERSKIIEGWVVSQTEAELCALFATRSAAPSS